MKSKSFKSWFNGKFWHSLPYCLQCPFFTVYVLLGGKLNGWSKFLKNTKRSFQVSIAYFLKKNVLLQYVTYVIIVNRKSSGLHNLYSLFCTYCPILPLRIKSVTGDCAHFCCVLQLMMKNNCVD